MTKGDIIQQHTDCVSMCC